MDDNKTPDQLASEGQVAYKSGDYLAAAEAFETAARGYTFMGDMIAAAEMANNRSVALLQTGRPQLALEAVIGTDEIFATGGDTHRQAMAIANQAAALESLDRLDDAASAYERSAELFKEIGETEMRATVLQSLSSIQLRTGRQLEALATMHAGLEGIRRPTPKQRLIKKLLQVPFKMMNRS